MTTNETKDQTTPTHLAHGDAYRKRTPSGAGVPGDDRGGLTIMDTWSKERHIGRLWLVPHVR